MAGSTLHTVSRMLLEWKAAGLVTDRRQNVGILAPHALGSIAEDLPEGRD